MDVANLNAMWQARCEQLRKEYENDWQAHRNEVQQLQRMVGDLQSQLAFARAAVAYDVQQFVKANTHVNPHGRAAGYVSSEELLDFLEGMTAGIVPPHLLTGQTPGKSKRDRGVAGVADDALDYEDDELASLPTPAEAQALAAASGGASGVYPTPAQSTGVSPTPTTCGAPAVATPGDGGTVVAGGDRAAGFVPSSGKRERDDVTNEWEEEEYMWDRADRDQQQASGGAQQQAQGTGGDSNETAVAMQGASCRAQEYQQQQASATSTPQAARVYVPDESPPPPSSFNFGFGNTPGKS